MTTTTTTTRRSVLIAAAATALGPAAAQAAGTRTIAVKARLVTRDIVPDTTTAGFLTDHHLGRGTVDYTYDRSTGGLDRFRAYYPDGWFDVQLDLQYAPPTLGGVTGTGRITRGSGRFKGARGRFTSVAGTFDAAADLLDVRITGSLTVPRRA